jgi:hypothetical protein
LWRRTQALKVRENSDIRLAYSRDIRTSCNVNYSWHMRGRSRVDIDYPGVSVWRAQISNLQHTRQNYVIQELAGAVSMLSSVWANYRTPNQIVWRSKLKRFAITHCGRL